jgi:K+/H+ antiporter YhaU regulatory subunit KhtT
MGNFKKYKRIQIAEMRPVTEHEADNQDAILDNGISVSQQDLENGSPKIGDMIARNPKNHKDQWLVSKQYFQDNFEPL